MKNQVWRVLGAILMLCAAACAASQGRAPKPDDVVADYLRHLGTGNVTALDALFFRIPVMGSHPDDWLKLIVRVSSMVKEEQLAWEIVCSKELAETAAVIVNQTMKHGKAHADPDALFLVKQNNRWLLLPDAIAPNARREVQNAMTGVQAGGRYQLRRWATGEIRGIT